MKQNPKNFDAVIHNEEFEKEFAGKELTHQTMIYDAGRETELLSGVWHFAVDQYDMSLRSKWFLEKVKDDNGRYLPLDYDFEQWETTKVPSCWNMQKEKYFYYESNGLYTRKFKFFKKNSDERVFLKIGAASYSARVFLNKKFIGSHQGASTPFYVEITKDLQEENRIFVVVENRRKPDRVPMHNTDWFNYGGLYRDVELIRVPETFIRSFYVQLVPDTGMKKMEIRIDIDGNDVNGVARLVIEELGIDKNIKIIDGKAWEVLDAQPVLWAPENPKLYKVQLVYEKDSIQEEIGFREIKVDGTDILLNGEKIFLAGISCHEESVLNGKAITEEEIIENFTIAKEMNCNYMRLAHYPHTSKAAKIADRMGIMLWEEIPVYWSIAFENKPTYEDAENQLIEMINRDQNRASVIIWSVGNENADIDSRLEFMKSLALKTKQVDPSRPISAACCVNKVDNKIEDRLIEYLDIIGINQYYGWYDPDFGKLPKLFENSDPSKPVIITEFGGGAKAGHHGAEDEYFTEENQRCLYRTQISTMRNIKYIKGMSPWILYDFRCPRRTNPFQELYNRKGLLSEDKKIRKPGFYIMQNFYQEK